ncbi:MAG: Eco57I restriction-modification methylase domain-containing protein, partial [Fimbriimonadaceae bacterium]
MARNRTAFQCVRIEGGLLPSDFLARLAEPGAKEEGTRPEDYDLAPGERLNEAISSSWNRLLARWRAFREAAQSLPEDDAALAFTNDRWTLPLLRELGFGVLPVSQQGREAGGRSYPISRFFHGSPIHLIGFRLSLDERAKGQRGAAAAAPHAILQGFLNASEEALWGLVCNGLKLRILRDNQALSRQSYVEFDLEAMFDGEVYSDFVLLWLVAHATRFLPERDGAGPETCWLERWCRAAQEQGTRVLTDLRGGVEKALGVLCRGFTTHPKNAALRQRLRDGELSVADLHAQLLRLVYRLLFLLVAESRTVEGQPLLHVPSNDPKDLQAREVYERHFSVRRLRTLAGSIRGSRHGDLWRQLQVVLLALSGAPEGEPARKALNLPALGSFLWDPAGTADLNGAELANRDLLEAIRKLAFTSKEGALREVDFANLGSEELGGVYESLLGLTPELQPDGSLDFQELAGNERKTSGSYYTPDDLVQLLLDSALDPVVREATKGKRGEEAERAILELKVVDPAVGSGHFLVGAARRLARHLAEARARTKGEEGPSPLEYQRALRDVVSRCLYGVDLNPMAAELCRVSLWLEALEPGKPLAFLEHHVVVGNSILGATSQLVAGGIPDAAYKALDGDDKDVCRQLAKENRACRDELGTLFAQGAFSGNSYLRFFEILERAPDGSIEQRRDKEQRYEDARRAVEMRRLAADLWCAAFLCPKTRFEDVPTTAHLRQVLNGESLNPEVERTVRETAQRYRLFHYELEFPAVFQKGGFDVVLGNPPWEKVELKPEKFFQGDDERTRRARSEQQWEPYLEELRRWRDRCRKGGPEVDEQTAWYADLLDQYEDALRQSHAIAKFISGSGRFPDGGVGRIELSLVFTDLSCRLLHAGGYVGLVVPTAVATTKTSSKLFRSLTESGQVVSLYDFENGSGERGSDWTAGAFFPHVDSRYRFALLVVRGLHHHGAAFPAAFRCRSVSDTKDPAKLVMLDAERLARLNPETGTVPVAGSSGELRMLLRIFDQVPTFFGSKPSVNLWGATLALMFHSSNKKHLYRSREQLEMANGTLEGTRFQVPRRAIVRGVEVEAGTWVPLWEGRLVHQFDHRWATYGTLAAHGDCRDATEVEKADPAFEVLPRHWVHQSDLDEWRERPTWRESDDPADRSAWRRLQSGVGWWLGWRDLTNATNERTSIWAVVPAYGANQKFQLCLVAEPPPLEACLLALANSLVFDWLVRHKLSGNDFTFTLLRQLPVLPPDTFLRRPDGGPGGRDKSPDGQWVGWIARRAVALTFASWSVEPFARACGYRGEPYRWDPSLRRRLRSQLDAALFRLYGIGPDDAAWMMDEFPIL